MWNEFLFSIQSKMTTADNGMNDNNGVDDKYPGENDKQSVGPKEFLVSVMLFRGNQ